MERLGLSSAEAASQLAELSPQPGCRCPRWRPRSCRRRRVRSRPTRGGHRRARPGAAGRRRAAAGAVPGGAGGRLPRRAGPVGAHSWPRPGPSWPQTVRNSPARWRGRCWRRWRGRGRDLAAGSGRLACPARRGGPVGREASHWRHIPPQLDCPAQRVARGGADLWWPAGRPQGDGAPVTGPRAGARAVLALRERNGELLGVMRLAGRGRSRNSGPEVRQHLSALAAGCARVLGARLAQAATWPPPSRGRPLHPARRPGRIGAGAKAIREPAGRWPTSASSTSARATAIPPAGRAPT